MNQRPDHILKDQILEYLYERKDDSIHNHTIAAELFPSLGPIIIDKLLVEIAEEDYPIVIAQARNASLKDYQVFFTGTELTGRFLRSGGFTKAYEDQTLVKLKDHMKEKREIISHNESIKNYKRNFVMTITNTVISLIALAVSIYLLLKQQQII